MRRSMLLLVLFGVLGVLAPRLAHAQAACFTRLDSGVDLTGWRKSTTNHHGPGDGWTVEGGALVGRQTTGNKGGLLMTERTFKDVEVVFDVKVDWGCDSGFFFRTTAGDRAYQVTIDHLQGAGVGIVWGESFAQELYYKPFTLTNQGNTAVKDPAGTPVFDVAQWPTIWKPTQFNEMRARVEGNPPHIQVWISGVRVADFTDTKTRGEIDASGPLGIQVHVGVDRWAPGGSVQFKNIRVRDLAVPCATPDAGTDSGTNAAAGTGGATDGGVDATGAAGTGGGAAGTGGAGTGGGAAGSAGAGAMPDASNAGCDCAMVPRGGGELAALVLLAGVVLQGRRRRAR